MGEMTTLTMRYMRGHFIVTAPDTEPVSVRRSKLVLLIVRPVILTNGPKDGHLSRVGGSARGSPAPARGGGRGFFKGWVVGLRPSSRSFAETRARVRRMRMG